MFKFILKIIWWNIIPLLKFMFSKNKDMRKYLSILLSEERRK